MFLNFVIQTVQCDWIRRCQKLLCWLQENVSESKALRSLQFNLLLRQGVSAFTLDPTQTCLHSKWISFDRIFQGKRWNVIKNLFCYQPPFMAFIQIWIPKNNPPTSFSYLTFWNVYLLFFCSIIRAHQSNQGKTIVIALVQYCSSILKYERLSLPLVKFC
jgi:hypothetical protein